MIENMSDWKNSKKIMSFIIANEYYRILSCHATR
jgi:hypothetical protein